ncbi:MAG: hypothetical protein ABEK42_07305, partial [Thiohalorhabdaceae bacterium]
PLAELDLPNAEGKLGIRARAEDDTSQRSTGSDSSARQTVAIVPDEEAPKAGITKPPQGQALAWGKTNEVHWKATDASGLRSLRARVEGRTLTQETFGKSARKDSGSFSWTPAKSLGKQAELTVVAEDVYGNKRETSWRFPLRQDTPPDLSIRHPSPGVQRVEGEPFELAVRAQDDNGVRKVAYVLERNGKAVSTRKLERADGDKYFSGSFRAPAITPDKSVTLAVVAV